MKSTGNRRLRTTRLYIHDHTTLQISRFFPALPGYRKTYNTQPPSNHQTPIYSPIFFPSPKLQPLTTIIPQGSHLISSHLIDLSISISHTDPPTKMIRERLYLTLINIFFPPLTILLITGTPGPDFLLNVLLLLCGVLPGHSKLDPILSHLLCIPPNQTSFHIYPQETSNPTLEIFPRKESCF